ncbi:hypothetical protein HanRHA438_Chr12g0546671 [Helianthus annuus]|nr:hypothetical protein HanRHA438_Chr12g0546671 [Helianthus annuus]
MAEWGDLNGRLSYVSLSSNGDGWHWVGDPAGQFSVGSVKWLISSRCDYSNCFVMEWCKWLSLKCNIFV